MLKLGSSTGSVENKGADQLCSNCTADQRLCFRCTDSTIPLLLKSKICSFQLFSVTVQPGLCRTQSVLTRRLICVCQPKPKTQTHQRGKQNNSQRTDNSQPLRFAFIRKLVLVWIICLCSLTFCFPLKFIHCMVILFCHFRRKKA